MPDVGGIAGDRLKSFIERIERLDEERRGIAADIKELYAEAKGYGFDTKIMRQIIKERRMNRADLDEQEALLDVYRHALGMLADTPLGEATLNAAQRRMDKSSKTTRPDEEAAAGEKPEDAPAAPRRRGRPPGSKNKKAEEPAAAETAAGADEQTGDPVPMQEAAE